MNPFVMEGKCCWGGVNVRKLNLQENNIYHYNYSFFLVQCAQLPHATSKNILFLSSHKFVTSKKSLKVAITPLCSFFILSQSPHRAARHASSFLHVACLHIGKLLRQVRVTRHLRVQIGKIACVLCVTLGKGI
jgi:hypothetical protein